MVNKRNKKYSSAGTGETHKNNQVNGGHERPATRRKSFVENFSHMERNTTPTVRLVCGIVVWCLSDTGTSNLNKYVYRTYDFRYPFFFATIQTAVTIVMTSVMMTLSPASNGNRTPRRQKDNWRKIALLGALWSCNNVLSKVSTRYVSIALFKTIIAGRPAVTLLMSALITGLHGNLTMKLALLPICCGTIICVYGDLDYHVIGVVTGVLAVFTRSARSVLQVQLLPVEELQPVSLLHRISYPGFIIILTTAAIVEPDAFTDYETFTNAPLLGAMVLTGVIGTMTVLSAAYVTSLTNYMTQSVLSNLVTIFNIMASVVILRTRLSVESCLGIFIVFVGVTLYNYGNSRYRNKMKKS